LHQKVDFVLGGHLALVLAPFGYAIF
jgi:hypothetical protein